MYKLRLFRFIFKRYRVRISLVFIFLVPFSTQMLVQYLAGGRDFSSQCLSIRCSLSHYIVESMKSVCPNSVLRKCSQVSLPFLGTLIYSNSAFSGWNGTWFLADDDFSFVITIYRLILGATPPSYLVEVVEEWSCPSTSIDCQCLQQNIWGFSSNSSCVPSWLVS